MSLKIYEHSANYTASVINLPVKQKVEGLDNLVMIEVFGNKCLIGKDSDETQLYLFFPSGTQLSDEFLSGNNLYRDSQLNADINQKGFFEPNGRVKAIKFRGIISSGFVIPVHSLKNMWTNGTDKDWACGEIARLKTGDEFNEFDGKEVCRKYVIKQENVPGEKKDRTNKMNERLSDLMIPNQFRFHSETEHLAKHLGHINPEDIVLITDKWHGSSCILSQVLIAKKLTFWQKLLNKLGGMIPNKAYGYIYSSGKPKSNLPKGIEGAWINDGPDFYASNIWKEVFEDYKHVLEEGISIYGEIVGFETNGSAIQKGYDYGCSSEYGTTIREHLTTEGKIPVAYRFVVYRITYTKPDGGVIEFTWPQMVEFCNKYGLETVKKLYYGTAGDFVSGTWETDKEFQGLFFQQLQLFVESMGNCTYCVNPVPAEGVVVRKDGGKAYKLKASAFLAKESSDFDKGETNIEDNA